MTSGLEDLTGGIAARLRPYEYDDDALLGLIDEACVDGLVGAAFLPDAEARIRDQHASTTPQRRGGSVCGVVYSQWKRVHFHARIL